jgi:hypothetical protein
MWSVKFAALSLHQAFCKHSGIAQEQWGAPGQNVCGAGQCGALCGSFPLGFVFINVSALIQSRPCADDESVLFDSLQAAH